MFETIILCPEYEQLFSKDNSNNGEVSSTTCTQPTAIANQFYKSEKVAENGEFNQCLQHERKSLICHKIKISTV